MAQTVNTEVPFEQLLEAVDHLDSKERDLLRDRLIRSEEQALVEQAEEAARRFKLPGLSFPLTYWSVETILAELGYKLELFAQKFGVDSKLLYLAAKRDSAIISPDEKEWTQLYETVQRLRAAKRQVDVKAGRTIEPLPVAQIVSKKLTLAEVKEKLNRFEKQHGLSSAEFYERFKQGQQGDSSETFDWLHTYIAYLTITEQYYSDADKDV
jgi:hypothetical protein